MLITLSVSTFVKMHCQQGDIDAYSGLSNGHLMGQDIHKSLQGKQAKNKHYSAEVWVEQVFSRDTYQFKIKGRIDGLYTKPTLIIEEIKTAFNINKLVNKINDNIETHPFSLQLKTYGYLYWLQTSKLPELQLLLVSSNQKRKVTIQIPFDIATYEAWFDKKITLCIDEICETKKRIKLRKQLAAQMVFPFKETRIGQDQLIKQVNQCLSERQPMLIQAPTGLGKTIGVLYPALKESLSKGQKVIYLTPKNTQQIAAEDAVERLSRTAPIHSITIGAKHKLCLKPEPLCNPEYCEYAKDHYTKIYTHDVINQLSKVDKVSENILKDYGRKYLVCPYELQLQSLVYRDVIICDFNYVFSPVASQKRISQRTLAEKLKPSLIIDEVHNLPARAMSYYSPTMSSTLLYEWRLHIEKHKESQKNKIRKLLDDGINLIRSCKTFAGNLPQRIEIPLVLFETFGAKITKLLMQSLDTKVDNATDDILLKFHNYWSEFANALKSVSIMPDEFILFYEPATHAIKITCCDAAKMIQNTYKDFRQFIGFSATLKPFDFYLQLCGLPKSKVVTVEITSPFPKNRRKILIVPQISTKFKDRHRSYSRLVELITKIIGLRQGNYFVFFPSFEYLENVYGEITYTFTTSNIHKQTSNMSADKINEIFTSLREGPKGQLIFAVQGGIFAEGIDYPGEMIIGAFIIGPPLAKFDWEREQLAQYYQRHYKAGFDYAYTYPAMAKAIQAAGRVIRSAEDSGLIVLVDNRFLQGSYHACMPSDWYTSHPQENVSKAILADVSEHWRQCHELAVKTSGAALLVCE